MSDQTPPDGWHHVNTEGWCIGCYSTLFAECQAEQQRLRADAAEQERDEVHQQASNWFHEYNAALARIASLEAMLREVIDEWIAERKRNGYDSYTDSMLRARSALEASAVPTDPVSHVELPDGACGVMRLCERRQGHEGPHQTSVDRAIDVLTPATAVPEPTDLDPHEARLVMALELAHKLAHARNRRCVKGDHALIEGVLDTIRLRAATPPGPHSEETR